MQKCSLEELQTIILDENQGPRWYRFLSQAIAYDRTLYEKNLSFRETQDKFLEAKMQPKQYKQINDRFAAKKDENEHQMCLVQEELLRKKIELERGIEARQELLRENKTLRSEIGKF